MAAPRQAAATTSTAAGLLQQPHRTVEIPAPRSFSRLGEGQFPAERLQ
ncbi:hypothetical protein [Amycolatopsis sp. NBC_01480]|nr:hypothetical protein [Amycolatopsis sp. NBC_01480]